MPPTQPPASSDPLLTIGFLAYPRFTALDLVGPFEVLARVRAQTLVVAASPGPVTADGGLTVEADVSFGACPPLDVLLVPGGPGQMQACEDPDLLSFVNERAERARLVLTVCTGALIAAKAGPLRGHRAATHWLALAELGRLGAIPVAERVVRDGKFLSTAGVSAGIDGALILAAELIGDEGAQAIQLAIEYDPTPPFDAGSPKSAPAHIVERLRASSRFSQ